MYNASKIALLVLGLFGGGNSGHGTPLANRNYIVDGAMESAINNSAAVTAGTATKAVMTMYTIGAGAGGAGTATSYAGGGLLSGVGSSTGTAEPIGMTSPVRGGCSWQQSTASTGTVAASTAAYISQSIEDARTLNGRSSTFSCWLWVGTGQTITIPSVILRQTFGTGGSPSAQAVSDKAVNWVITSTPQRFSVRLDIPSTAGKTLGTNSDSLLQIGLWLPPGVTFTLATTQWQLEQSSPQSSSDINGAGGLPTAFEYRGSQAELARVQRFYEAGNLVFNGPTTSGSTYGASRPYIVSKRATPTVTLGIPGLANFPASISQGGASTADNLTVYSVANATGTAGYYLASFIADARLP